MIAESFGISVEQERLALRHLPVRISAHSSPKSVQFVRFSVSGVVKNL